MTFCFVGKRSIQLSYWDIRFLLIGAHFQEMPDRAVVSFLRLFWKKTPGDLAAFPVIVKAFAAFAFSRARFIRARAH